MEELRGGKMREVERNREREGGREGRDVSEDKDVVNKERQL